MKNRDPLVQTLLSLFIPFYLIYWLYVSAKDLAAKSGKKEPNIMLVLAPFIVFFVGAIILGITGLITGGGDNFGGAATVALLIFVFLVLPVSFALMLVYFYKYGGLSEAALGTQASRVLIFILLWFVSPAAVYIIQEKLNSLSTTADQNPQPPAQNAPTN